MSIPTTIKALQIQPDWTVKVVDIPFGDREEVKNLAPNEVVMKVKAVGINPTDWKHAIADMWGEPFKISGCDAAGEIVKVGSEVKHVKVGDRAFGFLYGARNSNNGAYAEYARFSADAVGVLPPGMSFAEGAAFPIPHITAYLFLYFRLPLPPPSTPSHDSPQPNFLVWGGASSVGHHAIQLAKLSGYRVITTASEKNHEHLKSIGADVCIDYKDPQVHEKLKAAVKNGGDGKLKYAIDTISENGSTEVILDTITEDHAHITVTLPVNPTLPPHLSNTKVEFALAYEVIMDKPFNFARALPVTPRPDDREKSRAWLANELPRILEGWQEGKGSPRYKGQNLKIGHGLEKVHEGLQFMKEGKVSNEKLVYII